jgi:hypothetical protein
MDILDKYLELEKENRKEFLNENKNEIIILLKDDVSIFEKLLKGKIVYNEFYDAVSESSDKISKIIDILISEDYIPGDFFLWKIIEKKDDTSLVKLLDKFSSLQISNERYLNLVNLGLTQSAIKLLERDTNFQKVQYATALFSLGYEGDIFDEIILGNQNEMESFMNLIRHSKKKINKEELISRILPLVDDKTIPREKFLNNEYTLTEEFYLEHLHVLKERNRYSRSIKKNSIKWNPILEKIGKDNLDYDFIISECPSNSVFRIDYIKSNPKEGTNDELFEILEEELPHSMTSSRSSIEFYKEAISRGISFARLINIDIILEKVSPAKFRDMLNGRDEEIIIYFYKKLPSKYKPQLEKLLSKDAISKLKKKTKKKSYFPEIMKAFEEGDSTDFELAKSNGYTFSKFIEDSRQTSKQRGVESLRINSKTFSFLTKEEILLLVDSEFRFGWDIKLRKDFTYKECLVLRKKIDFDTVFFSCHEQLELLKYLEDRDISQAFYDNDTRKIILESTSLLKQYVSEITSKKRDCSLCEDSIRELIPFLNKSEIIKLIDNPTNYVLLKDKNQEYVFSIQNILDSITSYSIESLDFLRDLKIRDEETLKLLVNAYLSGNKRITVFLGRDIKIRRNKQSKKEFEALAMELSQDNKVILDHIYASGGYLDALEASFIDYKVILKKYDLSEIKVKELDINNLDNDRWCKEFNYTIDSLNISNSWKTIDFEENPINVKINRIFIKDLNDDDNNLMKFLVNSNSKDIPIKISSDIGPNDAILLLRNGVEVADPEDLLEIISKDAISNSVNLDNLEFLLENKLIELTVNNIHKIISSYYIDVERLSWVGETLKDLSMLEIKEEKIWDNNYEDILVLQEKYKFKIIKSKKEKELTLVDEIINDLNNYELIKIDVSKLLNDEKMDVITHIEENIDDRYRELNLKNINLSNIKYLYSYDKMLETEIGIDTEAFIKSLNPSNKNKKSLLGLKNFINIGGGLVIPRVNNIKKVINRLSDIEFVAEDFFIFDNSNDVQETSLLKEINTNNFYDLSDNIWKKKKKNEVIKLITSCKDLYASEIRDAYGMVEVLGEKFKELLDKIKENPLEYTADDDLNIKRLFNDYQKIKNSNNLKYMHDKAELLLEKLKSNPFEKLNQDYLFKLSESNEYDYPLYFPETRGDLMDMGSDHDWCVGSYEIYGDEVIVKGNILVGICEKNTSASKENIIALANFEKLEDGYELEQLKWSSKKKDGRSNVDATEDFDHIKLINLIQKYLEKQ